MLRSLNTECSWRLRRKPAPEVGWGRQPGRQVFFRWGLGGFGRKLRFDVLPAQRFQPLQHFFRQRLDQPTAAERRRPAIRRGLRVRRAGAVIACHEHQIARGNLGRSHHGRRHTRQERAGGRTEGRPGRRPRGGGSLVNPHGGLRRARAAVANDRPMHQWRAWLARGGVQPLQDTREPAARRYPPTARHTDLEAGGVAEMPVLSERSLRATGPHDQAGRGPRNHALQVGSSG